MIAHCIINGYTAVSDPSLKGAKAFTAAPDITPTTKALPARILNTTDNVIIDLNDDVCRAKPAKNKHAEQANMLQTCNAATGRAKSKFLPFKKALLYARSLKLKGRKEWRVWCRSDSRKGNMPSHPHATYKHDGWQGYRHWLGIGTVDVQGNGLPAGWNMSFDETHQTNYFWDTVYRQATWSRPVAPAKLGDLAPTGLRQSSEFDASCSQRPAVPSVQEGTAARTLPQAKRLAGWQAGVQVEAGKVPQVANNSSTTSLPTHNTTLHRHASISSGVSLEDWQREMPEGTRHGHMVGSAKRGCQDVLGNHPAPKMRRTLIRDNSQRVHLDAGEDTGNDPANEADTDSDTDTDADTDTGTDTDTDTDTGTDTGTETDLDTDTDSEDDGGSESDQLLPEDIAFGNDARDDRHIRPGHSVRVLIYHQNFRNLLAKVRQGQARNLRPSVAAVAPISPEELQNNARASRWFSSCAHAHPRYTPSSTLSPTMLVQPRAPAAHQQQTRYAPLQHQHPPAHIIPQQHYSGVASVQDSHQRTSIQYLFQHKEKFDPNAQTTIHSTGNAGYAPVELGTAVDQGSERHQHSINQWQYTQGGQVAHRFASHSTNDVQTAANTSTAGITSAQVKQVIQENTGRQIQKTIETVFGARQAKELGDVINQSATNRDLVVLEASAAVEIQIAKQKSEVADRQERDLRDEFANPSTGKNAKTLSAILQGPAKRVESEAGATGVSGKVEHTAKRRKTPPRHAPIIVDGAWAEWVLNLGTKERNEAVRNYNLTPEHNASLQKVCLRRHQPL